MFAHDNPMPGKWVLSQRIHIDNEFGPQWIQMDVTHQLQQVGVFLTQYGFIPVLKQVTGTPVTSVETNGVAGQQPPHDGGDRSGARLQQ